MSRLFVAALAALALCGFAGNSLLCRAALAGDLVDPASFTLLRLASGALTLAVILRLRRRRDPTTTGSWGGAVALFVYAAAFSFSYRGLTAATGALLLFGAVQITMLAVARARGERFRGLQFAGSALAIAGLIYLVLPGVAAPPLGAAALMLVAGIAWGAYTLIGRTAVDALAETTGNFARAVPMAVLLAVAWWLAGRGVGRAAGLEVEGAVLAIASGALTSGLGYAIWYAVLPFLSSITAATLQLSVPALTGVGGAVWLAEPPSARLVLAGLVTLGGIGVVIFTSKERAQHGEET